MRLHGLVPFAAFSLAVAALSSGADGDAARACDNDGEDSSLLQLVSEVTTRGRKNVIVQPILHALDSSPVPVAAAGTAAPAAAPWGALPPTCTWRQRLAPIMLCAAVMALVLFAVAACHALFSSKIDVAHALLCSIVAGNNLGTTVTMVESHQLAMSIGMSTSWSGFSVSAPRLGQVLALLLPCSALVVPGWEHRLRAKLVISLMVGLAGAVVYSMATLEAAGDGVLFGGLATWVLAARVVSGVGAGMGSQIARSVVPLVAPPEEKVFRIVCMHLSAMFGLGLGPILVAWLTLFDPCPGHAPDYLLGGPAWVLIALSSLVVVTIFFPSIAEEIGAHIEAERGDEDCDGATSSGFTAAPREDRGLVVLTLVASLMRMMVTSGLEVGTVLFLETPYGWSHRAIGIFTGSLCLLAIPGASVHQRAKNISAATFTHVLALFTTLGCVLLFGSWDWLGPSVGVASVVAGQCLLLPGLWLGDAVLAGQRTACLGPPGTTCSPSSSSLQSQLVALVGLLIGPGAARWCIEVGGRSTFAMFMTLMVLSIVLLTQFCILPRLQPKKQVTASVS